MTKHQYEQKYTAIRISAFRAVISQILHQPLISPEIKDGLKFSLIQQDELLYYDRHWKDCPSRKANWDWRSLSEKNKKHPDRFEIAVWFGNTLCGLAIGTPSKSRSHLSLHYIEAYPVPQHPLRGWILPLVYDTATAYGLALGCQQLHLIEPLPAMIPRYVALGFRLETPKKGAHYCWKELGI